MVSTPASLEWLLAGMEARDSDDPPAALAGSRTLAGRPQRAHRHGREAETHLAPGSQDEDVAIAPCQGLDDAAAWPRERLLELGFGAWTWSILHSQGSRIVWGHVRFPTSSSPAGWLCYISQ